ncbi:MAG TPA: hypothetical protein VHA37_08625, partial [Candidatus Saccharimonadales bacterium]|nr:hypothetical protein [Candidatus Saccharimonadales bacterium]
MAQNVAVPIALPRAPIAEPVEVIPPGGPLPPGTPEISGGGTIVHFTVPSPLDNSPVPIPSSANPLPLLSAALIGGSSTSFRVVAGSNLDSADPLALQTRALLAAGGGNVTIDGHFSWTDSDQTINAPTMIRTGTGSIDIAAAGNVSLLDKAAPAVIYTAGAPATGAPVGTTSSIVAGNPTFGAYDVVATPAVNPDRAGDISILAQGNITGIESVTGAGTTASQFWYEWMQTGNTLSSTGQIVQTSINFGAFDQGVMSVGGNVGISAGGDIRELSVSLPVTWDLTTNTAGAQSVNVFGGGGLAVRAGGNILSGTYFVADGSATLTAGGSIGPDFTVSGIYAGSSAV